VTDEHDADGFPVVDEDVSDSLRERLRVERAERQQSEGAPFFDRGPGYARLSGGRPFAEVDLLSPDLTGKPLRSDQA
jgi:N-methylhydantoinase B